PPHGQNPRPPGGGLPQGNYDIFIIPPHSAGGGFLYLPSMQPHRNSFLLGVACTLLAVGVWTLVMPVLKQWTTQLVASGGVGVLLLVIGVGVAGWAWGKTQVESEHPGPGHGGAGQESKQGYRYEHQGKSWAPPPPGPEPQPGPQASGPPPNSYAPPPPPPPPPQSEPDPPPPPKPERPPPPKSEPEPKPAPKPAAASGWEKAREETRKREEERKRAEELRKKREEAQKLREEAEKAAKAKAEKEKWEQARAREKEQREREARERIARARLAREKEAREKETKEREATERFERQKEEVKARAAAAAAAAPKTPPPPKSATAAPKSTASSNRQERSAAPTSYLGSESGYRPYDEPTSRPKYKSSGSSISGYSESSYAPSASTARTTPPPSHRGPYSTTDPDKIQIKAVYLFSDSFPHKPLAQLISNEAPVTDGLILRIKTEGLFIDDDVRGVPQREWDVKAWTLKHIEEGDAGGFKVVRFTTRDAENKKFTFVLDAAKEGGKVSMGLQRLRKGPQVRALGMNGLKAAEMQALLGGLGWL
ncbi:hypothetical protein KC352_g26779, partial [Hortaea werneckii]